MALTDAIKKYRTTGRGRLFFAAIGGQAIDESVALATEAVQVLTAEQRTRLVALWRAH